MFNPFSCQKCGGELESDDAVSVIEGVCGPCRSSPQQQPAPPQEPGIDESSIEAEPAIAAERSPQGDVDADQRVATTNAPFDPSGRRTRGPLGPPIPVIPFPARGARPSGKRRRRVRALATGVCLGLVVTIGAAYYLTHRPNLAAATSNDQSPAQSIVLRVEPPEAEVTLDGVSVGTADAPGKRTLVLPPHDETVRWLEVRAEGYHADRRPASTLGGVEEVYIELRRKPFEVAIQTDPPQAEVWIDGQLKGFSPLSLWVLPTKRATSLMIRRSGFFEVCETLTPPSKGNRLDVQFDLEAAGPVLYVESDPPGADITVEGIPRGTAPVTIELDPARLGGEIEIVASAQGRAETVRRITLPDAGQETTCTVRLNLEKVLPGVELWTVPPGGRVILEGKDLGTAPVVATFDRSDVGKSLVAQASLAESYHGSRNLTVPPAGETARITIPLKFNAQRVAFLLCLPPGAEAYNVGLIDHAAELIHRLRPQQRFAILAQADGDILSWPGGLGTVAATSEQKVRAYDMIRSLRPSSTGEVLGMLRSALGFRPSTICLMTTGEVDPDELREFSTWSSGYDVSIHVVAARAAPADAWIETWTARHHGTLTILGTEGAPAGQPMLAVHGEADAED